MFTPAQTEVRALSIAGPYAYCIAIGWKTIELRSWQTRYRGLVLLHTSTSRDWDAAFDRLNLVLDDCPKSAIQGAATLVDCIEYTTAKQWNADLEKHQWLGEDYDFIRQEYYAGKPPIGHVFKDPILFNPPILDVPGAYQYWLPKRQRQIEAFSQAIASLNEQ